MKKISTVCTENSIRIDWGGNHVTSAQAAHLREARLWEVNKFKIAWGKCAPTEPRRVLLIATIDTV